MEVDKGDAGDKNITDGDAAAGAKGKAKTNMANDDKRIFQMFTREVSEEERIKYINLPQRLQKQYRTDWFERNVKKVTGAQTSSTKDIKQDTELGVYKTFGKIVEDQGGLIDIVEAKYAATNIVNAKKKKGFPHVVYNPESKVLNYLDVTLMKKTMFERMKGETMEGEFDADEEMLKMAGTIAKQNGLDGNIPEKLLKDMKAEDEEETQAAEAVMAKATAAAAAEAAAAAAAAAAAPYWNGLGKAGKEWNGC